MMSVGEGANVRQIAYRAEPARKPHAPGLFWLAGYMSDMASTKATALAAYARENGLAFTGFDYSGVGRSGGDVMAGTLGRWLEEAEAAFTQLTHGPQIIVGSSMGGYIALLLLRRLMSKHPEHAARIRGLVLIAPAWDMTEELMWKNAPPEARRELEANGVYLEPTPYGEPYRITRALIEDGRQHLIGGAPFDPRRPVVILQGLLDADVPASHARELTRILTGGHVRFIEIADGEHRLSRPQDLAQLYAAIQSLL